MSTSAPAIPLFGDAYLADTHHLTLEEHGAYLKLLMIAWRMDGCTLPNDDARIANMLGLSKGKWSKLKAVVMAFWTLDDNGWTQARLSKERAFVDKKRATNRAAAEARWNAQDAEKYEDGECERMSGRNAPPPPPPKVEEEVVEATPQQSGSAEIRLALDVWNSACAVMGWPVVKKFTPARQQALRFRIRDDGLDGWQAGIARARASPLLSAQPPPTWFNFDFIVKPGNFAKLIEGNYDRAFSRNGTNSSGPSTTRTAAATVFGPFAGQASGPTAAPPRQIGFGGGR